MKNKLLFSFLILLFASLVFAGAQTSLSNGLEAYFTLDETNQSFAPDIASGLHNATLNGGPTQGISGVINSAYSFDGNNDFLDLPNPTNACLNDNLCTLSFWVKYTTTTSTGIWYEGLTSPPLSNSVGLEVKDFGPPGTLTINVRDPSGGIQTSVQTNSPTSNNQWTHVAIIGNVNTYSIYIGGLLINQQPVAIVPQGLGIEHFAGGVVNSYWPGQIDEIGIWNRALSAAEVSELYGNGQGLPFSNFSNSIIPSPPVLSPIGPQTVLENQTLSIQLHATDPNGNNLTFLTDAKTVLPSYVYLDANTGLFTWTPTYQDQGVYNVTFYVTDGQFIDSEVVSITVQDVSLATISVNDTALLGAVTYFNLHDPLNANMPYAFGGSFGSSPGIPLGDGRVLQLNDDWLFNALIYVPQLFGFSGTTGTLDSNGNAQVIWNVPNIQGAAGINLKFAFATLDNGGYTGLPQSVLSISPAASVTLTNNQTTNPPPTNNTNNTWPLVAQWHFDEGNGTTTADASGNGNTGTLENGVQWTSNSISGQALHFDGVDDKISTIQTPSIFLTQNISIEAWIKRDALGYGTIASSNGPFFLAIYNNKVHGGVYTSGWTEISGTTNLQVGTWYKLKMSYDGSHVRVYVNDIEENATIASGQIAVVGNNIYLGWGLPGQDYYFNGTIDEVTIRGY